MANVKEVEWQGGIYNIADEASRGVAQQAHALANTAQAVADVAQTTANAVSDDFNNYKELKTAIVNFGSRGFVLFQKRGNICEISIAEPDAQTGTYIVSIPAGFTPLRGTGVGALPLTWAEKSYGYWIIENGNMSIHIVESHSVNTTHAFLM